jgi:hypothetical protein
MPLPVELKVVPQPEPEEGGEVKGGSGGGGGEEQEFANKEEIDRAKKFGIKFD